MNYKLIKATALTASLLVTGCATQLPTAEEETAVWLSEAPRTLKLTIEPGQPVPRLRVRDHKVGERIAKGLGGGVAGAGLSVLGGCMMAPPLGCILGVIVAPVGAVAGVVVGASKPDSVDVYHGIEAAQGAPALYAAAAKREDVIVRMAEIVVSEAAKREGSRHRLSTDIGEDGDLKLAISSLDLAGADGDDPSVALVLSVDARLTYAGGATRWWSFEHRSSRRAVSAWAQNDAAAFREELAKGMKVVALELLQSLHEQPAFGVASKVTAARERTQAGSR